MNNSYDGLANTGERNMGKGLFRSKTFWINLITGAVSLGTYFMGTDLVAQNPEVVAIGGTVIGALNIFLRLITNRPIEGVLKK